MVDKISSQKINLVLSKKNIKIEGMREPEKEGVITSTNRSFRVYL